MSWWTTPGVPHKGWTLTGTTDNGPGEANHVACDACGTRHRYSHHVEHPKAAPMTVGCVCAEHLTDDYASPRERERALRRRGWRPPLTETETRDIAAGLLAGVISCFAATAQLRKA